MAKEKGKPGVKKGSKVKTKRFSIQGFDVEHYKRTEQYAAAVQTLFDRATVAITNAAAKGHYDPDKPFSFADYPSVQSVMQKTIEGLANGVTAVIETGSRKQWLFANQKNDAFLASIGDTSKVSTAKMKKWQDKNLDALKAFQERKIEGMNLSQRVWKYVGQYKDQIELGLDVGLGEGRSAAQLARDVKENLREPNKLFRRVRDKHGNLHLSKAAKAYHPGQGVYRSSVKNAQRLTRSEINMAYRESDFLRWQNLDFVVGFEIHRSTHEPLCKCKLCERLVGRYPKTFKFKGWHPQCMCYATPILMDEETRNANEQAELKAALTGKPYKPKRAKNEVLDVPDGFKAWVSENVAAQENWASTPYFIADNFIDGQLSLGLKQGANDGGIKTIMQAIEVAKGFGIGHIDFGDATVEQANIILEALQEEFDYFGDAGIPLNGLSFAKGDMHTKKEGGHYNTQTNEMVINLDIFGDDADSGKPILEKIASLEVQKAKLQEQIMQFEAKLGINSAADKMLKQDIKQMKSRVTDIEIKIGKFQKDIAAGHDEITFTYAYSLKDVKDRVKATIHHEFGHLFDHKFNGGEGYAGNAYNSTYAKTTDQEQIAEWFSQWMMGDKEGIPQELLDAFENKTAVDTFKPQLMAIMPEVEQARNIAKTWGLVGIETAIDSAIKQRNIEFVKQSIQAAVQEDATLMQELDDWSKKMLALVQTAMNLKVPVSGYAAMIAQLKVNKANWVSNKAKYIQAIQDIQNDINEAQDNEKLSTLLVDVADAKAQFGSDAVHAAFNAVESKLDQWHQKNPSLDYLKMKLEWEIKYLDDPAHQKYTTWEVAQKAYKKKLADVSYQIERQELVSQAQMAISTLQTSKSTNGKQLVAEWQALLQSPDVPIATLRAKLDEINKFVQHTLSRRKPKASKDSLQYTLTDEQFEDAAFALCSRRMTDALSGKAPLTKLQESKYNEISIILAGDNPDYKKIRALLKELGEDIDDVYSQSRKDIAKWHLKAQDADDFFHKFQVAYWKKATDDEKRAFAGYTSGSAYITEPLRAIEGHYYEAPWRHSDEEIERHINSLTKALDIDICDRDVWIKRDAGAWDAEYVFGIPSLAAYKNNPSALVGRIGQDNSFMSCGSCRETRFTCTGRKDVIYNIYCPKGTKGVYCEAFSSCGTFGSGWDGIKKANPSASNENEVLLQRGTKMRITKAEYDKVKDMWYIDVEVLAQETKNFKVNHSSSGTYCTFD